MNRAYYYKEVIEPIIPAIQQLKDGLNVDGLVETILKNPAKFKKFFVISSAIKLDEDAFLSLLRPIYSERGSNKYSVHINIFKYFTDFVEDTFNKGEFALFLEFSDLFP